MTHKYLEEWEIISTGEDNEIFIFSNESKYISSKLRYYFGDKLPTINDGEICIIYSYELSHKMPLNVHVTKKYELFKVNKDPKKFEVHHLLNLIVNNIRIFTKSLKRNNILNEMVSNLIDIILTKPGNYISDKELLYINRLLKPEQLIELHDKFLLSIPYFYSNKKYKNHARTDSRSYSGYKSLPKELHFNSSDPDYFFSMSNYGGVEGATTQKGIKGWVIQERDVSSYLKSLKVGEETWNDRIKNLLSLEWVLILNSNPSFCDLMKRDLMNLGFPEEKIYQSLLSY